MALQVWMPLDGSLRNLGTKSVTITENGTITYTTGKIGQAFSGNSARHIVLMGIELGTEASICCWSKTANTGNKMMWVLESTSSAHLNLYCPNSGNYYCLNAADSNQNPFKTDDGTNITCLRDNLWHHFVVTFNGTDALLYIDGEYVGKAETYKVPTTTSTKKITIAGGYDSGTTYDWNGEMNDFRVYDECLSAAEIKEIAKAMVCHYKLDDFTAGNLITNGYGRDGNRGWNTTSDSSDIPSVAGCEANVGTGWSYTRIPVFYNKEYKIQLYIKASTTANSYPSIEGIDDDNLRIAPQNTVPGFHAIARTTLSQELKPGDTVVHCTDLTNFSTTSYPYLAIFGYISQHGKHYDDYTYTRDIPRITPANINKTNNTIPLNSPYDGMYRPAGTAVCQSGDGAQYYYPFYGINSNNAPDWTLKELTFVPDKIPLLKYATYMRYITYGGTAKVAAVRLSLVNNCNDISDTSGYGHDGTAVHLLDSSSIHNSNMNPELARYDKCLTFASAAFDYINAGRGGMVTDAITVSMWASMDTWIQNPRFISCTEGGGWNFEGGAAYSRATLCQNGTYINATSSKPFTSLSNGWHHFAQTYDGYTLKYYIDGQLEGSSSTASSKLAITYNANNNIIIGAEATSSTATTPYFDGKISDVRIYATALSADDIKDLYSLGGRVDNLKNFHTPKIIEKKNNHMFVANKSILNGAWENGLQRYQQANCQVTIENNAVHIYRPPNTSGAANNMWGGFRFRNDDNVLGLQKGRSYLWAMTVSGQTSNSSIIHVDNNMGWSNDTSGLMPQPTDIYTYVTPANFTGTQDAWYAFTIPDDDDIYKECIAGYSTFVTGKTYISYRDFQYRFGYTSTGTLGTDLYITNIRFFDITDLDLSNITRAGIANFTDFVEDAGIASINMNKEFYTNSIIEI